MKRIVKKTAAALLAFTLTAAVFSGCGSTASSAASADATAESTFAASAEGGELEKVKAAGKLVIGVEGTYPPFTYHDDSGELTGLDIELGKALVSRQSFRRLRGIRCSSASTPAGLIRLSTASASPMSAPKNTIFLTPIIMKRAALSCEPMMTASRRRRT